MEDVLVKGYPVIRKGVEAWGVITSSKRPGVGGEWIVYDYSPQSPEPLFGHNGEFPMVQFHGGRLNFQIEGVYDVTGGEVPLQATDVVRGSDISPADPYNLGIVLGWEALRSPLQKLSGKHLPSLAGSHAVLRKGTEIEALVDAAVCYDVAFLERIRQLELIQAHEDGKAEVAIGHATADAGKKTLSLTALEQAPAVSDSEPAHRGGAARQHEEPPHTNTIMQGEQRDSILLGLIVRAPTSPANLAAAVHNSVAH